MSPPQPSHKSKQPTTLNLRRTKVWYSNNAAIAIAFSTSSRNNKCSQGSCETTRRTFVPLSSTEHKHSETQQIDFTSYSTNFPAHCPISFEPLWKKAKGCLRACLGFSHSGIIFLTCCRISSSIFTGEPNSATCLTPSLAYPPYSHST